MGAACSSPPAIAPTSTPTSSISASGRATALTSRRTLQLGTFSADGARVAFTMDSPTAPAEVFVADARFATPVKLTDVNPQAKSFALGATEVVTWKSRDGLEVEGVLLKPVGFDPSRRYPLLVVAHGGPAGAHLDNYRVGGLEGGQVWAGQGWAVFYPNPRGSSNYGEKFLRANVADWGGGDFADIMTGVDALIARGVADQDKLAHIGWSYGGYMTAWAITQTTRFKAAMVGAGLTNMWSMYGTNDIPSVLIGYFGGIANKETLPLYLNRSAMTHIDNVTTPTLILHGGNDERVPLGQAQELFRGLEGSRQDDRAGRLPARRPRHHGVLSPEGPPHADPRLGDHPRGRRRQQDLDPSTMTDSAPRSFDTSAEGVPAATRPSAQERLATLLDLGREVSGVLDLDELLAKIPRLISRLTPFGVFSVYLLDDASQELRIAYAEGYPEDAAKSVRLQLGRGHGRRGGGRGPLHPGERRAHRSALHRGGAGRPVDAGRAAAPPGQGAGRAQPAQQRPQRLRRRRRGDPRGVRRHVAQALANARLFESEKEYAETMETLAEVGREMSAILDLDELLTRVAHLVKRRDRLPHLRHRPGERRHPDDRVQGGDPLRRRRRIPRPCGWARGCSATPSSTGKSCSSTTCHRTRATSTPCPTPVRSWSCR